MPVKNLILRILVIVLPFPGICQSNIARYRIDFIDKRLSIYRVDKPEEFLTQRALDRRKKFHIAIDERDLPVSPSYTQDVSAAGARVICTSKWMNSAIIECTDEVYRKVCEMPFVRGQQKVATLKSVEASFPSQLKRVTRTTVSHKSDYGKSLEQIEMLGGTWLHDNSFKGQGKLIAVLDAGFFDANEYAVFDSAWANNRIVATRDVANPGGDVFGEYNHGTSVLSLMAGNSSGNIIGTAPESKYILVRTEESSVEEIAEEDYWIAGAEFADSLGADIINSSLGYSVFDDHSTDHTQQDLDGHTARVSIGAEIAVQKGMVVVTSAGNEGQKEWKKITFPADARDVITVGAVELDGDKAKFSSVGPSADGRVKPEVVALGYKPFALQYNGQLDNSLSGTSFSAPLVAGLTACLWQACPLATPSQLKDAIVKSASQYFTPDSLIGYGIPDFRKAKIILDQSFPGNFMDDDGLIISPNPYRDTFWVDVVLEEKCSFDLEVWDIYGKMVYARRDIWCSNLVSNIQVTLPDIPEGIFVVTIIAGEKRHSRRVVHLR